MVNIKSKQTMAIRLHFSHMKYIALIMLGAWLFCACNDTIDLSGTNVKVTRQPGYFSAISIQDGIELVLQQDLVRTVEIETDERILPYVRYEVKQDVLLLYCDQQTIFPDNARIRVYVNADSIVALSAFRSTIFAVGNITADTFQINLVNGSRFQGGVLQCKELEATVRGRSNLELTGLTDTLLLHASDGSLLNAYEMTANTARVITMGGSTVNLLVNQELHVDAAGASVVNYRGAASVKSSLLTDGSRLNNK